mmetsp:Transcript_15485/g.42787  ORF Transcript_15485/g.42787 Transcript_15485/m.42787 type:complete len:252 (+) Transcript_15485:59-814(+)
MDRIQAPSAARSELGARALHRLVEPLQVGLITPKRRPLKVQPAELPQEVLLLCPRRLHPDPERVRSLLLFDLGAADVPRLDQLSREARGLVHRRLVELGRDHQVEVRLHLVADEGAPGGRADDHRHLVRVHHLHGFSQLVERDLGIERSPHLALFLHLAVPPVVGGDVCEVYMLDLAAELLLQVRRHLVRRSLVCGGGDQEVAEDLRHGAAHHQQRSVDGAPPARRWPATRPRHAGTTRRCAAQPRAVARN